MHPDLDLALTLLPSALGTTIYMVFASAFFAIILGFPLGITLALTAKGRLLERSFLYKILETIVNIGRSFPFAILLVALIPFTRWLIGTSLGTAAAIVPLSIAAAPFFARLVETNLTEVDRHLIDAAIVMGSNVKQIVFKILLPEALSSLVASTSLTLVNLVGYSAMAGLVGGGGLGQIAIQYGYNRFNTTMMIATVALLILFVQCIQWMGNRTAFAILKKRGKL
ncbi:MAG TPA: methionine ABC transporter permease [Chlamydiales bacterium]|nr:methionine ABC transporter permease [Chlamydiales bacterium]